MDLIEFLRARLDKDEQIARAAVGADGRWSTCNGGAPVEEDAVPGYPDCVVAYDEGAPSDEQATHIARHDPARVLREIEAKRRIVDRHADPQHHCPEPIDPEGWSSISNYVDARGDIHSQTEVWPTPCGDLRDLAGVYADHPDYRAEWSVYLPSRDPMHAAQKGGSAVCGASYPALMSTPPGPGADKNVTCPACRAAIGLPAQ